MIPRERILHLFEMVVTNILLVALAVMILMGTAALFMLFYRNAGSVFSTVTDAAELQATLQRAFGGVLGVLLGLELIETVRQYHADHQVRVEIVFFVGLIAMGRHVLQLDLHRTSFGELAGVAAVIAALAGGYFLVRRARTSGPPARQA